MSNSTVKHRVQTSDLMTRNVRGRIGWFKRGYVLNYRDEKPQVYKIQIIRGTVIGGSSIVSYAAHASNVPESTVQRAMGALFDAVNYFVKNGHAVQIPNLGTLSLQTLSKTVKTEEAILDNETAEGTIKRRRAYLHPKAELGVMCNVRNIDWVENKDLSKYACEQVTPPTP